jgi:hypothetical protein
VQDLELRNGESISLQFFSITATGGFNGHELVTDETGDYLEFVREGSTSTENARVKVDRHAGVRRAGGPTSYTRIKGRVREVVAVWAAEVDRKRNRCHLHI